MLHCLHRGGAATTGHTISVQKLPSQSPITLWLTSVLREGTSSGSKGTLSERQSINSVDSIRFDQLVQPLHNDLASSILKSIPHEASVADSLHCDHCSKQPMDLLEGSVFSRTAPTTKGGASLRLLLTRGSPGNQ